MRQRYSTVMRSVLSLSAVVSTLIGIASASRADRPTAKMVGGTYSDLQSTSVGMMVLRQSDGDVAVCTGTLVGPREVLTAAHCLRLAEEGAIVLGGSVYEGVEFIVHPGFNAERPSVDSASSDVGIMILRDTPSRVSQTPILSGRGLKVGDSLTTYGYGLHEGSSSGDELDKRLGAGKVGSFIVSAVWPGAVEANFSGASTAVCSGDSGGPAMISDQGVQAIAGIASYGSTSLDNSGACYVTSVVVSGFVDLSSPSSEAFLRRFPAIKRLAYLPPTPPNPKPSGGGGVGMSPEQVALVKKQLRNHYLNGRRIARIQSLTTLRQRSAELGDEVSFLAEDLAGGLRRLVSRSGSRFIQASKQRSRRSALSSINQGISLLVRANRAARM